MVHQQGSRILGQFGDELPDRVIETERAVLREQQDRRRRELLGDRTRFEHGVRRDGRLRLEVGHPIAPGQEIASLLADTDRAPRRMRGVELGEDAVGVLRECRYAATLGEGQGGNREQGQRTERGVP